MSKNKIADSIIIRVGGGIREVPRNPVEIVENLESAHRESGLEQKEEIPSFGVEVESNSKIGSDNTIN